MYSIDCIIKVPLPGLNQDRIDWSVKLMLCIYLYRIYDNQFNFNRMCELPLRWSLPRHVKLFWLVLFLYGLTNTVNAKDEYFPYKITILQPELESKFQPLLRNTLQQNRENLEQAGIHMSVNKLIHHEMDLLARVLRSEGFYEQNVDYLKIKNSVEYRIEPGRAFHIEHFRILSRQADIRLPAADTLGLKQGMRLRAADVLAAKASLDRYVRDHNCLWQVASSYEVRLNRMAATADINFTVKPARQVKLGKIAITGLKTVHESFVRRNLKLQPGQCYRNTAIEKARLRLLQDGLFSMVNAKVSPPINGLVNLNINLKERHNKTIQLGAGYSTDESISLTAGWEHRNLFGNAERLDIQGKLSQLYKTLDSTLTIPAFRNPRQALVLEAKLSDEHLAAYDALGITLNATIKRKLAKHLVASAGLQDKFLSIREIDHKDINNLLSFPVILEYDGRDNVLDPHKGWVASLKLQPFVDLLNPDIHFLKTTLGASVYHTLPGIKFTPTLAARAVIGSINGVATDTVPADERFYAGGGGSVRGYSYQKLGPLIKGIPTGGRSLLEVSMETRLRFTKKWGGVLFIDGGNVYASQIPKFNQGLRWAFGVGARYFTSLAPIRLDIGFPINGRKGIDGTFQLYISLAQAF